MPECRTLDARVRTATSASGGVRVEIDAGVAVVTIDRPEVRNAIGFATIDELDAALDARPRHRAPRCSCCAAGETARSSPAATSRSSARSARTRTRSRMASRVRRAPRPRRGLSRSRHRGAERARARRRRRGRDRGRHPHRGRRRQDRLQPGDARHHAGVGWRRAARAGDRPQPRAAGDRDRRALRRPDRAAIRASSTSSSRAPRSTTSGGARASDGGRGTRHDARRESRGQRGGSLVHPRARGRRHRRVRAAVDGRRALGRGRGARAESGERADP